MKKSLGIIFLIFVIGCASYQSNVLKARQDLSDGKPQSAVEIFEAKAKEEGKDQVLYMLDHGLALHQARNLKKSNEVLMEVDRLADVKDYVSLSRQAGSLFLSEALIQYKSERFENLLINAYLAINFILLGDFENALVECRRMDEKLYKMKLDNEDEKKSFFARYLSAMIWEAEKNWDSAYIDYLNAYNLEADHPYLRRDLIRAAWRARRYDDLKKWEKQFPSIQFAKVKSEAVEMGELVFLYQQGWIPRKHPRPGNYRFPYLVSVPAGFTRAVVEVDGKRFAETEMLYNVGREAKRTLDADFNYLVAKKIIGVVAKEVLADQIRQKNEALGALASIAMHLADQADLRQWSTLPDSIQISKLVLKPGTHNVVIYARGGAGETKVWEGPVTIKKGQKTFLSERTFY